MHIKDEKKNEMHIAKIQPNQTKIVRKVGLLTNKTPINQNKTETHISTGITKYVIIGFNHIAL